MAQARTCGRGGARGVGLTMPTAEPFPPPVPDGGDRPPRAAATIVVVRDAPAGMEVLLCRRAERGDHNSGAWVFPGGLVDAGDRQAHACCAGLDDAAASRCRGLAQGGLDYFVFTNEVVGITSSAQLAFGHETITDFQDGIDLLAFEGGLKTIFANWSDISSHISEDANGNAVITFNADTSITLVGIHANQLDVNDFLVD